MTAAAWLTSIPRYSEASQIIPTVNSIVAAINSAIINPINSVIYPTIPSAPVNLLGVTVGNTGSPVFLTPNGPAVDTNVGLILAGRGSNPLSLGGAGTSATASLRVVNTTNSANFLQVTSATSASPLVTLTVGGATSTAGLLLAAASGGVLSLGGSTSANASLRVVTTANAANFLQVTGATSASPTVVVAAVGATSNVTLQAASQGTGEVQLLIGAAVGFKVFTASGADVNFLQTGGAAANGSVSVGVAGSSTDIGLRLLGKNAGVVSVGGTTSATASLRVATVTNAANFVQISGATSATPNVEVAAVGATAEVFLQLTPQGTSSATVRFGNATCFQANGSVATTMGSLGPANSHSDIQKWLRIIDQAGTSLFIPCY